MENQKISPQFQKISEALLYQHISRFKSVGTEANQKISNLNPNIVNKYSFFCSKNKINSYLSCTLETYNKFYLFLFRTEGPYTSLIIQQYRKENGSSRSVQIAGIKDQIYCAKALFCKKILTKGQIIKTENTTKVNKKQSLYQVVLLMGSNDGYLKIIRFSAQDSHLNENKINIQQVKLDFGPMVHICSLSEDQFFEANICLVLAKNHKVFLVDYLNCQVLSQFFSPVVTCDVGLTLKVNQENRYFIQVSEGGYIVFWKINDQLMDLIRKSSPHSKEKVSVKDILHQVLPMTVFHSATINGIRFFDLYGNLLLIVTKDGILKLLYLNVSHSDIVNNCQYCYLLEYPIQNGHLVSDCKAFPLNEQIFLVKSVVYDYLNKKRQENVPLFEQTMVKKGKKNKNIDVSRPYLAKSQKQLLKTILYDQKEDEVQFRKICFFQRIKLNSELEIQSVDQIFPQIRMSNCEQIQMTQNRQIILLRSSEGYLIGQTDLFKND